MPKKLQDASISHKSIEVKDSPGKGRGVFATKAIEKGETIEVAPVLMVPWDDETFVLASFLQHYTFSVYGGSEKDDDFTAIALGYASLYNHSDKENADWRINTKCIIVFATRNIKRGEEITIDYGWDEEHRKEMSIK